MGDLQIVVASKNVEAQYVELEVPLYSYGCEKKVKKALAHIKGIYSVNVDFRQQKVIVWGICNKYDVLATIKNKRKGARFWNQEDNAELEKFQDKEATQTSPPSLRPKRAIVPPLALIRAQSLARSLSWKSLKKVFERSYSF